MFLKCSMPPRDTYYVKLCMGLFPLRLLLVCRRALLCVCVCVCFCMLDQWKTRIIRYIYIYFECSSSCTDSGTARNVHRITNTSKNVLHSQSHTDGTLSLALTAFALFPLTLLHMCTLRYNSMNSDIILKKKIVSFSVLFYCFSFLIRFLFISSLFFPLNTQADIRIYRSALLTTAHLNSIGSLSLCTRREE